jgi:hypothetical protein
MKHHLHSEIDIDTAPATVWVILTDLDHYSDWNPFIISATGDVAVGARLNNRLQPPDGKAMTFKPTVTAVEAERTLEWLGRLILPGVFDGRHRFELEATPTGGTRLVHSEHFNGVLVRFMRKSLDTQTVQGFELMNTAIKARAEALVEVAS